MKDAGKRQATKSGMRWPGHGMTWKDFLVSLKTEWVNDAMSDTAGNLVFAGVLALFPFLIFLVALGSLLIEPAQLEEIIHGLGKVAPAAVTEIVAGRLRSLQESTQTSLLTGSAAIAIWSASGGMTAMMRGLNNIYAVRESRPFWKVRGTAILLTLLTAALALIAALSAIAAPAVGRWIGGPVGDAILWLRLPVAAAAMMFLWAIIYYAGPDVEQRFRFITPGSVIGVALWLIASWGFSVYVANFGKYDATYGALGSVIILLLWMWISAQVLLLGAEVNAVLEHKSPGGKVPGARRMSEKGSAESKSFEVTRRGSADNGNGLQPGSTEPVGDVHELGEGHARAAADAARQKPMGLFKKTQRRVWAAGAAVAYLVSRRKASS